MVSSTFLWSIVVIVLILPLLVHTFFQICQKFDCCGCLDQYFSASLVERQVHYTLWSTWIIRIKYFLLQCVIGLTFYTFVYSEFVKNIDNGELGLNIIFHIAQCVCIILYALTSITDPGIITPPSLPIQSTNNHAEILYGIKNESKPLINTQFKYPFEPIAIDISSPPICYCWECKFISPIRSRHDYETGTCVARYDHYSSWIGNAIGARNHRYYVLLLMCEAFVFVTAFVLMFGILLDVVSDDANFADPLGWFVIIFVLLYMFILCVKTLPTLAYHLFIISKNRTTLEMMNEDINEDFVKFIKGVDNCSEYNTEENEFDRGILTNWWMLFTAFKDEPQYFYGLKCSVVKNK